MSEKTLAIRLKQEMEKQNWTGRKLSQKANLSYNAVHYILSGKNKSTNFEVVNAISEVLGVSPFYLLDENYNEGDTTSSKNIAEYDLSQMTKGAPYNGELYRNIMSIVELVLKEKNKLTFERVDYFTHFIYPQISKSSSHSNVKDLKSYIEGIIDYALNQED